MLRRHFVVAAFCVGLAAYGAMLIRHASRAVAGSDSSGYFNAARLLAQGKVARPLPVPPEITPRNVHSFTPLAFVARPDGKTIVPLYPPGVPLHVVAAAALSNWSSGPHHVSP